MINVFEKDGKCIIATEFKFSGFPVFINTLSLLLPATCDYNWGIVRSVVIDMVSNLIALPQHLLQNESIVSNLGNTRENGTDVASLEDCRQLQVGHGQPGGETGNFNLPHHINDSTLLMADLKLLLSFNCTFLYSTRNQ